MRVIITNARLTVDVDEISDKELDFLNGYIPQAGVEMLDRRYVCGEIVFEGKQEHLFNVLIDFTRDFDVDLI